MPSPARKPINFTKERSPHRADLFEALERRRIAGEVAAEASRSFARVQDQVERGETGVRTAEAALAAIDAKETEMIREWDAAGSSWPPPTPSPALKRQRAEAEDALALARRIAATVRHSAESVRGPAEQETAEVAKLTAALEPHVRAVMVDESKQLLAQLAEARAAASAANGAVRSLAGAMVAKGWFPEAEAVNAAFLRLPTPEPVVNPAPYLELITRLRTDADAEVRS